MPIGILLCRERLADAGGAKAQANVAIIANRVGELNESPAARDLEEARIQLPA
jgi:hypothetical protein